MYNLSRGSKLDTPLKYYMVLKNPLIQYGRNTKTLIIIMNFSFLEFYNIELFNNSTFKNF